ncbi:hypothetical protein AM1_B0140 (plasmid) [Acaryochloris marina MBIC11017]|uniref:Uncharacterized protein n=1 Tax=Acaryochloris marina (strain MBIC 11017) TaxID=329726 RepID=A8ZM96_ACAM1|nr:hypothetical protein AM1_B0140 [Acaryochloris marina MBIC11017]
MLYQTSRKRGNPLSFARNLFTDYDDRVLGWWGMQGHGGR